jgi:hypothetical protein
MHVRFVSPFLSYLPPLFFASISSNSLCARVARTGVRPGHELGGTPARTLDVCCDMHPPLGLGCDGLPLGEAGYTYAVWSRGSGCMLLAGGGWLPRCPAREQASGRLTT